MTRITISAISVAVLMASGCVFGTDPTRLPVSYSPVGASVRMRTGAAWYDGEMLEVTQEGVLLNQKQGGILFVPFRSMKEFAATGLGSQYKIGVGGMPFPEMMQRMKAISHFPQGTTPDIMHRLLAQARQTDVVIAR